MHTALTLMPHGLLNEEASQQKLHTLSPLHIISAPRPNNGRTNFLIKYGFMTNSVLGC
jgi:hypothetical protein